MHQLRNLERGDRLVDPVGLVHIIGTVVNGDDGPMFVGTACCVEWSWLAQVSVPTEASPTCLACALGTSNRRYAFWLKETLDGPINIKRAGGPT